MGGPGRPCAAAGVCLALCCLSAISAVLCVSQVGVDSSAVLRTGGPAFKAQGGGVYDRAARTSVLFSVPKMHLGASVLLPRAEGKRGQLSPHPPSLEPHRCVAAQSGHHYLRLAYIGFSRWNHTLGHL